MDEGNGFYYMRARYYDPEAGRFINKDPIGLLGGIDQYVYAGDNPVNYIDPSGLFWGIPMGEGYGGAASQYYASVTLDPCSSRAARYGAWAGGLLSSLWMPETSADTAMTLVGGYSLAGWASKTGPWLGKIAYHGAHSGGPHQYPHLQVMIRTGRNITKHLYLRLWR